MASRSAAALAVVGDSPTTHLVAGLAADLSLPVARPGERSRAPVVLLAGGRAGEVEEVLHRGHRDPAAVFVEPGPWLGSEQLTRWFGATAAPVGAALYPAWSPVVTAVGREIAGLGPLGHVEVRIGGPPDRGDALGPSLALAAWSLAGAPVDSVESHAEGRVRIRCGATTADVDAGTAPVPVWSLQAASADGVVRLELAPEVSFERNGEPVALPGGAAGRDGDRATAAARHLGWLGFLDDLRTGRLLDQARWPAGAHPLWALQVTALVEAASRSLADGGRDAGLDRYRR